MAFHKAEWQILQGSANSATFLTLNYDRSLQTDLIITDFLEAFDVVPHHRLIYWYGIIIYV